MSILSKCISIVHFSCYVDVFVGDDCKRSNDETQLKSFTFDEFMNQTRNREKKKGHSNTVDHFQLKCCLSINNTHENKKKYND